MRDRNVVKQGYRMSNAKYDLTTSEIKLIAIVLAQIDMNDKDFKEYQISISEIEDKIQKEQKHTRLKQFAKNILSKPLSIEKDKNHWIAANWFSSIEYESGVFRILIDPKLKPYLLELKSHFIKYDIRYILPMKSVYSIKIYPLLKQYEKIGKREFNLKEMQDILKVPTSYKEYKWFRRRVLLTAQKELKQYTDICFTFDAIKTGRKVTDLVFHIKKNADNEYVKKVEAAKLLQKTEAVKYSPELREFVEKTKEHYKGRDEFLEVIYNDKGGDYIVCINENGQLYDKTSSRIFTDFAARNIWEILYNSHKKQKEVKAHE